MTLSWREQDILTDYALLCVQRAWSTRQSRYTVLLLVVVHAVYHMCVYVFVCEYGTNVMFLVSIEYIYSVSTTIKLPLRGKGFCQGEKAPLHRCELA